MSPQEQHAATLVNAGNAIMGRPDRMCVCCGESYVKTGPNDQMLCEECRAVAMGQCCSEPDYTTVKSQESADGVTFTRMRCGNCGAYRNVTS